MAKQLFTEKDALALLAQGGTLADVPKRAILTPAAKDRLKAPPASPSNSAFTSTASSTPAEPILPDYMYRWEDKQDPQTPAEIAQFFNSPEIETQKERMCEMGRRMFQREYTDGNGGNMVVRVGHNLFLTTQTLISKGFMTPETICLVDWDGKQLAGKYKRTSECMTHLGIFRNQPKCRATCHAHPVHATAFAVAGVEPPSCMIPEAEVFLGKIGVAPYRTPGSPENAEVIGAMGKDYQAILMVNHGAITWGEHIEDAYWKMENIESYCKVIWIAQTLGKGMKTITGSEAKELIAIRQSLGMEDFRSEWKECELCDNSDFREGATCEMPATTPAGGSAAVDEALVQSITDQIMAKLG